MAKKDPAFHGSPIFILVFTRARQGTYYESGEIVHAFASELFIFNTYFNYRPIFPSVPSLPSCLFSSGFLIKILIHFSSSHGRCMWTGFKWLWEVSKDGPLWTWQWNKLDTEVNKKSFLCRETTSNSVVQPVASRSSRFTDWAICHYSWVVSKYL
jgi:hypothetical protein